MAQLTGTVTKDARILTSSSGKKFAAFDFVENDSYRDKQGNRVEKSYFFNCTLWNAEKIAPFITKGTIMQLEGNVTAGTYASGTGETKASMNMTVRRVKFLGSSKNKGANDGKPVPESAKAATAIDVADDLPF